MRCHGAHAPTRQVCYGSRPCENSCACSQHTHFGEVHSTIGCCVRLKRGSVRFAEEAFSLRLLGSRVFTRPGSNSVISPLNDNVRLTLGSRTSGGWAAMSATCRILLQKSARNTLRAKIRNNRIGANPILNQHCALAPDLDLMLHARVRKIFLQQYLPTDRTYAVQQNGNSIRTPRRRAGKSRSAIRCLSFWLS